MNHFKNLKALRSFLILLVTQTFSALGSSMTSFALVIWSYQQQGSALRTALLTLFGIQTVILFDLLTFAAAFVSLLLLIHIPEIKQKAEKREPVLAMARDGLGYLGENPGILHLILFLAAINFSASVYNAAFPAMLLSREGGGEIALGLVNSVTGAAMIAGSVLAAVWPKPRSRVRVICNALLLSMSTENFLLAFGRSVPVWCVGAVLGWIGIPLMNANMDVLLRRRIPVGMQGRVYSARNTLQFFTIPIGYVVGGFLVDRVFEPLMAAQGTGSALASLFGTEKGSGAACLFAILWLVGLMTCLVFRRDHHIWMLERE